jgi:hypothetical protein
MFTLFLQNTFRAVCGKRELAKIFPSKAAIIRMQIGSQILQPNRISQGLGLRAPGH